MGLFSKKPNSLKAVYEDDLIGYLKSTGLLKDIEKGRRLCKFCGKKITLENLEVIFPNGKQIDFICNNKNCLNQL